MAERGEHNPAILVELERTLALLAFDDPEKSPFGDLLHPSHRQRVASELNAAILKAEHRESTTPQLVSLMKLVMWAQDQLDQKKVCKITFLEILNLFDTVPKYIIIYCVLLCR